MKDIFTDLYNKVLGFFRQSEKKEDSNTKDVACNRLKFVLMQDRTNLTPELMDRMRKELIELLSKYVEMDKEALELGFEQEGTQMALMLSIPVVRAKEESEIEAILAKEDEEKAKLQGQDVSDSEDSDDENNNDELEAETEAEDSNAEDVDASDIVKDIDSDASDVEISEIETVEEDIIEEKPSSSPSELIVDEVDFKSKNKKLAKSSK